MRRVVLAGVCVGLLASGAAVAGAATKPSAVHATGSRSEHRRHGHRTTQRTTKRAVTATLAMGVSSTDAVLLGDRSVEAVIDDDTAGSAEAFAFTAAADGLARSVSVYVDARSRASSLTVGVYAR